MAITETSPFKVTPSLAVWRAIMTLRRELHDWENKDDPNGVVASIQEEIAALEQARIDLEKLKTVKAAFAALSAD
jgi:hypothetical protein